MTLRRAVCVNALPLLILAAVAAPAAAHSELRLSVPAAEAVLDCPPEEIELHFNEKAQLTALRLHQVDGAEIELPRRAIREAASETIALPPLPPGDFRAEWRILSPDGHVVGGVIPFRILGDCQP
ncbi:MAG: copper resistance protein CopC [Tabrizicola sp.]|uniref:copper resistance CopC family protein n=1 Tax=Tabrizicola sp. TaxID=2005166 RepID=UPI0027375624|nr:copper resistance CopC family protein [Tabrizicola sp.]MDP3262719.1 copper resistance protein CopC [Tabrizicola sp.]MDP3648915.1 copper resistance protein CopC [Paracoccaceae bacterium]MDZ4067682.1 copper resistance protein CopC [Tabrizicola sp.]